MNRLFYILAIVLTTSACTHNTDDLVAFTTSVQSQTQVAIEPAPSFATLPPYEYRSTALRSPFVLPSTQIPAAVQVVQKNCLTPNFSRPKQGLEHYGVDAIQFSGVLRSAQQKFALFTTNDGKVHKAQRGDYIGLFHGKITGISAQSIDVLQLIPDGAGCYQKKQISLSKERTGDTDNA